MAGRSAGSGVRWVPGIRRRRPPGDAGVGRGACSGGAAGSCRGTSNPFQVCGSLITSLTREIAHFFAIYKQPEGKEVVVDGWYDRDDALTVIAEARERAAAAAPSSSSSG